ncbi:MAG: FAD-dependent oxidoreductase, partial [Proteobacteria bacterium]|nr:FAD-dependent oxidoreductase [Pseudomonadota bacterium]
MRIAVVGSGISGLAAAWLLARNHAVTLYEAGDYLGGHTHTVDVTLEGATHGVDTGFLVFNRATYPNLVPMLEWLGIPVALSEMTFSLALQDPAIEWAGTSLGSLFAQRSNLVRPGFLRMLRDLLRFNREAAASAARVDAGTPAPGISIGEFLSAGRYSTEFRDWYLMPMAAAIWSCPTRTMMAFPY